jgi:hypothetical protein
MRQWRSQRQPVPARSPGARQLLSEPLLLVDRCRIGDLVPLLPRIVGQVVQLAAVSLVLDVQPLALNQAGVCGERGSPRLRGCRARADG